MLQSLNLWESYLNREVELVTEEHPIKVHLRFFFSFLHTNPTRKLL